MIFDSEDALDDHLSTPGPAVAEALSGIDGDLVVLGAGGKVGPTLCRMAARALSAAGSPARVLAVSRWSDAKARDALERHGVVTVAADLADPASYEDLPDAGALWFLAGQKFGTTGREHLTWWMNAVVPGFAAARYRGVPTVVYSSGNIYPFVAPASGGCTEATEPAPVGQYAQSCLAREQAFAHAAETWGTPVVQFRLNYAVELRYGVIADVAGTIVAGQPVDVTMGSLNCVWQRDSTEWSLRAIADAEPGTARALNATGPETVSTRALATRLGELMERPVELTGSEAPEALLNNAAACHARYGYPTTSLDTAVGWVADWVAAGGRQLGKATKFQTRDGRF